MSSDPPYQFGSIQPLQPLPPGGGARWEPSPVREQRTGGQICATWGIVAAVFVILSCALCVGMHFLRDVNVAQWWIGILFLLAVAGLLTYLAYQLTPVEGRPRRRLSLALANNSLLLLMLAATVYAISFLPMQYLLFLKSDEARVALQKARQREQFAAQMRWNAQRRKEMAPIRYRDEMKRLNDRVRQIERELAQIEKGEKRDLEIDAKATAGRVAAKENALKSEYAAGLVEAMRTPGVSIPTYAGPLDWKDVYVSNRTLGQKRLEFFREATPGDLVEKTSADKGLLVTQLKLTGAEFLPEVALRKRPRGSLLIFVRRSGELLEVTPQDWRLQHTLVFGGVCHDLCYLSDNVFVARENPGSILKIEYRGENTRTGDLVEFHQTPMVAPLQLAVGISVDGAPSYQTVNAAAPPLLARTEFSDLREVQELAKVREANGRFLPEQLGRDSFVDANREFFVAQKDGVYRGQLPASNSKRQSRSNQAGFATLDGKNFSVGMENIPLEQITWTKTLPAVGIDVTKFAALGNELLATCNDRANLLLFDKQGRPHSQHTWPGAGKTLGIASAGDLPMVLVFTEKSLFAVSTAAVSVERPLAGANPSTSPKSPTTKPVDSPPEKFRPNVRRYLSVANAASPIDLQRNIAGASKQLEKAKITELQLDARRWVWFEHDNLLFALEGNTLHWIEVSGRTIQRSIELSPADAPVTHLAWRQSRLVAVVPKLRQLMTFNLPSMKPTTYQLNDFTANESGAGSDYFASSRHSNYIALSCGPPNDKKTDIVSVRLGTVFLTIDPKQLKPPVSELQTMAMGDGIVMAVAGGRLYCIKWGATGWSQEPVPNGREDYESDFFAYTWGPRRVFMGNDTSLTSYNLREANELPLSIVKPREAAIEFVPDGDAYWLNNGKRCDLKGNVTLSLDLPKTGGGVSISPSGKKLIIGNQLIELTE
ncbi:hypothetical protein [Anatilimnocola floriformis]|uniref:hypothetical protein n=1 Tax=Anatilimnocola floriformis TaxID=2948575 RepID=UPI0020C5A558|nr:hypothetical protein [Anatilimnocola floriformis]